MRSGTNACWRGQHVETSGKLESVLREAEAFGGHDSRLAATLYNLARIYGAQGRYAQAKPLYECSFTIVEKALGPDHPDVTTSFENLTELVSSDRANPGRINPGKPILPPLLWWRRQDYRTYLSANGIRAP